MRRISGHDHATDSWVFDDPPNRAVITTRPVIEGHPIIEVHHDFDGDWQFLCGTTVQPEDGRVACLACIVANEPAVSQLADLPTGWYAWRSAPTQPWTRVQPDPNPPQ